MAVENVPNKSASSSSLYCTVVVWMVVENIIGNRKFKFKLRNTKKKTKRRNKIHSNGSRSNSKDDDVNRFGLNQHFSIDCVEMILKIGGL